MIRIHLSVMDLSDYFRRHPMNIEDLLKLAREIYRKYLTTDGAENALHPDSTRLDFFASGSPWVALVTTDNTTEPPIGDQVLSNTILRMRDSLLHYEFQCAIADGDIGRAMNIMAVSLARCDCDGKDKKLT